MNDENILIGFIGGEKVKKPCLKCRDMQCKDVNDDFCPAYIKWLRINVNQTVKAIEKGER